MSVEEITKDTAIGNNTPPEEPLSYTDETVIWSGRPSLWLNFGKVLWWLTVWLLGPILWLSWRFTDYQTKYPQLEYLVNPTAISLMTIPIFFLLHKWFKLKSECITITNNKITQASGFTVFFRSEKYCELSDVTDVEAPAAGLLGFVGRASLILKTSDDDQPIIEIKAIKNRDELRDQLIPLIRRLRVERRGFQLK